MLQDLPFSDGGARPTNGCMTSLHGLQHLLLAQEAAKPLNHQHGIRGACDDQVQLAIQHLLRSAHVSEARNSGACFARAAVPAPPWG